MRHAWTKEQENFIGSMIGYYPVLKMIEMVKAQFSLDLRDSAIKSKIENISKRSKDKIADRVDNYSMASLANLLGVDRGVIYRWIRLGLPAYKCGVLWVINFKELAKFAKQNPQLFKRVSIPNLEWLFDDNPKWVAKVLPFKVKQPNLPKPVVCVTTGKVYPSLRNAAIELGLNKEKIRTYVNFGLPTKVGDEYLTFKYVE